jgi:hypothetical protein
MRDGCTAGRSTTSARLATHIPAPHTCRFVKKKDGCRDGAACQLCHQCYWTKAQTPTQPLGPPPGWTEPFTNNSGWLERNRRRNTATLARNIEAANVADEDEWISRFGCANPYCELLRHSKRCKGRGTRTHCCARCNELDPHWHSDVQRQKARGLVYRNTQKHGKKCEGLSALDAFFASRRQAAITATESPDASAKN